MARQGEDWQGSRSDHRHRLILGESLGMPEEKFVPLAELADTLGLPESWLDREVEAGRIPHLRVGRRRFVEPAEVRRVLAERTRRDAEAQEGRNAP